MRPNYRRAPPHLSLVFFVRLVAVLCLSGPSGAPLVHLCAAGEGVFTDGAPDPQVLFLTNSRFFHLTAKALLNMGFRASSGTIWRFKGKIITR